MNGNQSKIDKFEVIKKILLECEQIKLNINKLKQSKN